MSPRSDDWLPFLLHLADREDRRKAALETRSTGIATTSAAVVAIITAGTAVAANAQIQITTDAILAVGIALALFTFSIVSAIAANLPFRIRQTDPLNILLEVQKSSSEEDSAVWPRIAATHVAEYTSLCRANNFKAAALWYGLTFQVLGCSALTYFIIQTL